MTELANGTRASYTYDAASRVQHLYNLKADGSVILGLTYEHDAVGNPTSMLESSGDRGTWTYDAADRLTREQRSGASAYDTTYTYDPLGNRLVKEASGARATYAYDLANQLTISQDAGGTTTCTYAFAGNLHIVEEPTGQRTTTTWDDQNRQTGVLLPDGSAVTNTFRFDGLRHSKEDPAGTTKFLWDFNNYLAETDDQDAIQVVYTNEPQQYGNLISQYRKGPTLWLPSYCHYDALGSTRVLTDEAGNVSDTYVYDAWGNEVVVGGSIVNPFRWVGQVGYYWDESTGTFYVRARVYEPVTGRWMSQDPLGYPVTSLSTQPSVIRRGRGFPITTSPKRQNRFNLFRAYFIPEGIDPSGLSAAPPNKPDPVGVVVEGKSVCGILLMEANGAPVPDAGLLTTNAIVPDKPFSTQDEILDFVKNQKCCTLYLLGHCGSTSGGIAGRGGSVGPVILPDDNFRGTVKAGVFRQWLFPLCDNIFACALVRAGKPDATREGIAKDTGCLTCGRPSGFQETFRDPLDLCSKTPWPHTCKPPKNGWALRCVEQGVAPIPFGPVFSCRRIGWTPVNE